MPQAQRELGENVSCLAVIIVMAAVFCFFSWLVLGKQAAPEPCVDKVIQKGLLGVGEAKCLPGSSIEEKEDQFICRCAK